MPPRATDSLRTSADDVRHYLALLFPDAPPDAWVVVSWLTQTKQFRSQWFRIKEGKQLTAFVVQHASTVSTYVGLGLRDPDLPGHDGSRGTSAHVISINALWMEYDHSGGQHAARNLPPADALLPWLTRRPQRFSLLVDSGGGIHSYLLFKEPWLLETPDERHRAARLLQRFQRTMSLQAAEEGWHVDNTSDLARVLRPAGTLNHKSTPPQRVRILHEDPIRYNPSELEEAPWMLDDAGMATPDAMRHPPGVAHHTFPETHVEPILEGCAWLRHCRDDADSLPEPEWHAMLGIVVRCHNGEALGHAWSAPYHTNTHQYSYQETQRKLQQVAHDERTAYTCGHIAEKWGGSAFCHACQHWPHLKTPLHLGEIRSADPLDPLTHAPGGSPGHPSTNGVSAPRQNPARLLRASQSDPERQSAWYMQDIQPYTSKVGTVQANNTTIMTFLRNHSFWQGKLWWDDMANKPMYGADAIDDHVVTEIGALFGARHQLPISNDRLLLRCLAACCWQVRKDPLQDWLGTLSSWDGVPRLDTWLEHCAGVTGNAYHSFVSRILMVSMIARAFSPGCLYRNVIVFEGPEEYRKSTLVANLVPFKAWHISLTSSFENKDVPMLIQGIWVAELSELDSLTRTEETRLKSFISETEDAYVPKWHLFRVAPKRRTIFVGTTNESSWLKSATGNTRFFPVKIFHPMDVEYFVGIREQLFAEAMIVYHDNPRTWWELPTQAQEQAILEREERRQASVYESDLGLWLETGRFVDAAQQINAQLDYGKGQDPSDPLASRTSLTPGAPPLVPVPYKTTWAEIATGFLRLDTPEKWKDMNLQKQVAHALKALGWRQYTTRHNGVGLRLWAKEPPKVV